MVGQTHYACPINIHQIDIRLKRIASVKGDLRSIRRPGRFSFSAGELASDIAPIRPIGIHNPYIPIPTIAVTTKGNLAAIRRLGRSLMNNFIVIVGQVFESCAISIYDENLYERTSAYRIY